MMGRTLEAWRIISGIGICNRQPDTLRLRLIGSRASGRIRPSIYERVEALASLAYGRPPLAATSTPLKECQWQKPSIAHAVAPTVRASEGGPGVWQAWGAASALTTGSRFGCLWLHQNSPPSIIRPATTV